MDVAAWLRDLGLEQYERAFLEHDIDADVLPCLTSDDLLAVGVASVGHRRKLSTAEAVLRSSGRQLAEPGAEVYSSISGRFRLSRSPFSDATEPPPFGTDSEARHLNGLDGARSSQI